MSYILEALKKAAEQRSQQTPALRRLVSAPSVRSSPSALRRAAAALTVGATAVVALLAVTLRSASPPAPPLADAVPTPSPVSAIGPAPSEGPRGEPSARPLASVRIAPPAGRVTPLVPEGRASAPAAARLVPVPPVTEPGLPLSPRPAGAPDRVVGLKLEVLVYSDVRTERMVFINGRKYVEGDTVPEGGRIEEIKQDGVVLSDQGRRFTLRQ